MKLRVILRSVGVKTGKFEEEAKKAHFLLDCRGILDPSSKGLGSGDSPVTQEWVEQNNLMAVNALKSVVIDAINAVPTRRRDKGEDKMWDDPFIILCLCAHGCHRSRAMKHIIGKWLFGAGSLQSDLPVSLSIEVE